MTIKYLTVLFTVILFFIQCRTSDTRPSLKKQYKTIYTYQFKLTYFRKLLKEGFNNSNEIKSIINFDRSGFTEPILTESDYAFIDSIVQVDNLKMITDSINRVGRVAEGAEGKHVFGFVLDKLQGKWLDSLAWERYKVSGIKKMYSK